MELTDRGDEVLSGREYARIKDSLDPNVVAELEAMAQPERD